MSSWFFNNILLKLENIIHLAGHQANGAFVAAGPPGFTALALLKLGENAREIFDKQQILTPMAGEIFYIVGVISGCMLLGCAWFFFLMAILPWWFKVHYHKQEVIGMYATTFPLVGMISTILVIGDIFECKFLWIVHAIFTIAMVIVWFILMTFTIIAFWKGQIFCSPPEAVIQDCKPYLMSKKHQKSKNAASSSDSPPYIV